ncbi:MAG: translation elongation factor Ts [Dehalococcoidia bacterium]
MAISTEAIKTLRERSGAGIMDCKRALEEAGGVIEEAEKILNRKGLATASKKAARVADQGLVEVYVHAGGRLGVMVEVNCETDFVARTNEFKTLSHDLALQVAAMNPKYVSPSEIPPDSDEVPEEVCLVLQPFIRDSDRTVQDIITETIAKTGENIRVRRFVRFELGTRSA